MDGGVENWVGGTLPPLETTAVRTVGKEKGKVNGKVLNSTPGISGGRFNALPSEPPHSVLRCRRGRAATALTSDGVDPQNG